MIRQKSLLLCGLSVLLISFLTNTQADDPTPNLDKSSFSLKTELKQEHVGRLVAKIAIEEYYSTKQSRGLILFEKTRYENSAPVVSSGSYLVDTQEHWILFKTIDANLKEKCTRVRGKDVWRSLLLDFLAFDDILVDRKVEENLLIGPALLLDLIVKSQDKKKKVKGWQELNILKTTKRNLLKSSARYSFNRVLLNDPTSRLPDMLKFEMSTKEGQLVATIEVKSLEGLNEKDNELQPMSSYITNLDLLAIRPLSSCSRLLAGMQDNKLSSPLTRRLKAGKPIQNFAFEALIKHNNNNRKKLEQDQGETTRVFSVAYDLRVQKMRVDITNSEHAQIDKRDRNKARGRDTKQVFDLRSNNIMAYHKFSTSPTCSISIMDSRRDLSLGPLLVGSDQATYLGLARISSGKMARVYQSIGHHLPFWLDQQLELGFTSTQEKKLYLILSYFSASDLDDDELLGLDILTGQDTNFIPIFDKQELLIDKFRWSLDDLPEDASEVFSFAIECLADGDAETQKVSMELETTSSKISSASASGREFGLAILRSLEADFSLPLNRVFHLKSHLEEGADSPHKAVVKLTFELIKHTGQAGFLWTMMDSDGEMYTKSDGHKPARFAIDGVWSLSQCYYLIANQLASEQIFIYSPRKLQCELYERPQDITSPGQDNNADINVYVMKKVNNYDAAKVKTWLQVGIKDRWLSLPAQGGGSATFRVIQVTVDSSIVRHYDEDIKQASNKTPVDDPTLPEPMGKDNKPQSIEHLDGFTGTFIVICIAIGSGVFVATLLVGRIKQSLDGTVRKKSTGSDREILGSLPARQERPPLQAPGRVVIEMSKRRTS